MVVFDRHMKQSTVFSDKPTDSRAITIDVNLLRFGDT
jgi:hypothetical protein